MIKNKAIRDTLKEYLSREVSYFITTDRNFDARDEDEYVAVIIEAGEISHSGIKASTATEVTLCYRTIEEIGDDELDERALALHMALENGYQSPANVQAFVPIAWEYLPDRSAGFSGINLTYTFTYS